jgi:CTP:molybdopterin cytidylyltransferase MocA
VLLPLPDFDNTEKMAKLGRLHTLRNARRDAATQLQRTVMTLINQPDISADAADRLVSEARESLDRIEAINALEEL